MKRWWIAGCLLLWLPLEGCPRRELPPGLPAPEYEPPQLSPWPPLPEGGVDAGSADAPAVEAEGESDAGIDAPPAPSDGGVG